MRVTIKDVAKAAGVSPATVSFIINNKPVSISTATREKVLKAIDELHYRPNQLAVSLVTNTSNTIGLILPDSTNPFFASLSHCIEELLRKHNICLLYTSLHLHWKPAGIQYLHLHCTVPAPALYLLQNHPSFRYKIPLP